MMNRYHNVYYIEVVDKNS